MAQCVTAMMDHKDPAVHLLVLYTDMWSGWECETVHTDHTLGLRRLHSKHSKHLRSMPGLSGQIKTH